MNLELVAAVDSENPIEGDLRLTDDQLTLVDGADAVSQHLRNRLRFFLGEWFLDRRLGFPFFRDVFIKNPNKRAVRAAFRRTIRDTPGIATVSEIQLTVNADRTAQLDFEAPLDQGGEPLVFTDFILGKF